MKRISFNSKVVLGFAAVCFIVWLIDRVFKGFTVNYFAVRSTMSWSNPLDYFRLMSHVLGHGNWEHLSSNMMFFLLLGPNLEDKHGHGDIAVMIILTSLITGLIYVIVPVFSGALFGASGIVFMFIILNSFVGKNDGSIPVEFLIIVAIWVGKEVTGMFGDDNVSQAAHLIGGFCGAMFGFALVKMKEEKTETSEILT